MDDLIKVKTLLGHSNLDFSIECLLSFVSNAKENIWLVIFEDGTLTPDDLIKLKTSIPQCAIIDRSVCDALVFKKLEHYPKCLQYRETVVYARKIFDLILYDELDVLYIDSDIYFVRNFSLPVFDENPVFMYDSQNAYSFKPSEFLQISFPIFGRVNSGFFFFKRQQFDLDYIEQLLQNTVINKGYIRGISWLEQTVWSFLASRQGKLQYFDSSEVIMATKVLHMSEKTICVHLVSTFRNHFEKVKDYARTIKASEQPVPIHLVKAQSYLKAHHYYAERIVRRLKTYYDK